MKNSNYRYQVGKPDSKIIESAESKKNKFKARLKEYYLQCKALGEFKQGEMFKQKDIFSVAKSLGYEKEEMDRLLNHFWGIRLNLSELNEVLKTQGFFD